VNAGLGLAASAASATAAGITFGWLVPMTAVAAFALAVATATRSAEAGVAAGVVGWLFLVVAGQATVGRYTAAVTDRTLVLPYLAVLVCSAALVLTVPRLPRGTS
jgi:hypothetical protein